MKTKGNDVKTSHSIRRRRRVMPVSTPPFTALWHSIFRIRRKIVRSMCIAASSNSALLRAWRPSSGCSRRTRTPLPTRATEAAPTSPATGGALRPEPPVTKAARSPSSGRACATSGRRWRRRRRPGRGCPNARTSCGGRAWPSWASPRATPAERAACRGAALDRRGNADGSAVLSPHQRPHPPSQAGRRVRQDLRGEDGPQVRAGGRQPTERRAGRVAGQAPPESAEGAGSRPGARNAMMRAPCRNRPEARSQAIGIPESGTEREQGNA